MKKTKNRQKEVDFTHPKRNNMPQVNSKRKKFA